MGFCIVVILQGLGSFDLFTVDFTDSSVEIAAGLCSWNLGQFAGKFIRLADSYITMPVFVHG